MVFKGCVFFMIRLKLLVFIIFVFFVGEEGVGGLLCGGGGGGDYTKKTVLACRRVFYFSERAFIFELTNTKISAKICVGWC